MAKLVTIQYDDTGRPTVTHTELSPDPPPTVPSSPKKRAPSSPHKPYTSSNFYDLTKSDSPDVSPKPVVKETTPSISSGFRALQQMDRENIVPGPFSESPKTVELSPDSSLEIIEIPKPQGFKKGSHFIDPETILPANSLLWKSSKIDVRKPSWKSNYQSSSAHENMAKPYHQAGPQAGPSRATATPIAMPSNPPRTFQLSSWSSSFIHPDSIPSHVPAESYMSPAQAEEALKGFFESALEPEDDEKEDIDDSGGTIEGLNVTLMKHQIEGLQFLHDHESDDDKVKAKGKGKHGGILADDMGLGKTIQTLALILTHPRPPTEGQEVFRSTSKCCKGTLLVVPLALVDQWRREIVEKTTLKAYVHHGPKRENDPARIAKWDVVITTYDTVSSEWSNGPNDEENPLNNGRGIFRVNWWRIVLDEAHTIKNPKAKMSQACCALSARFRWCLTGTPYQNTVDDVYSLVKFLRIPPFAEWTYWKERITTPSKGDRMSLALTRLRTLLRLIMIRRTKDVLKDNGVVLPPKEVLAEELEFDETERRFYDDLLIRGQQVVEELKNSKGGLGRSYMCLLTMLLRLRQGMAIQDDIDLATDHVDLLKGKLDDDKDALSDTKPDATKEVDDLAAMMSGLGIETKCTICFTIIITGRERCDDCEKNLELYQRKASRQTSSKIRRMLEILKTPIDNEQVKTIVFSQFTSMLDLIEPFLRDHNIKFGRYDGKMRKDQRDTMLTSFRTTSLPVLLVSLKSGSVGLNLTSASRVIMLDMWWNPAIEEQAIDRVHRIGQTKRVVVHKLTIRNSIDEKILELQNKKREAANGALGDGVIKRKGMKTNKLSLEDVLFLFSMPDESLVNV